MYRTETKHYEAAHGRKPKGYATWQVVLSNDPNTHPLDQSHCKWLAVRGNWGEVRQWAEKQARKYGYDYVVVAS